MKSFKIIYTLFFVLIISSCDMITEDVQSDVDVLKTELENLQTQINEMESQLNEKDSQIDDLSESLDESIKTLTQEIDDLSNSLDSSDSSILEEINDLTILLNNLTIQYNELQVSVASIEERLYNTVITLTTTVTNSMYEQPNTYPKDLFVRSEYITQESHIEFWIRTGTGEWQGTDTVFASYSCDGSGGITGYFNIKYVYDGVAILRTACANGLVGADMRITIVNDTY